MRLLSRYRAKIAVGVTAAILAMMCVFTACPAYAVTNSSDGNSGGGGSVSGGAAKIASSIKWTHFYDHRSTVENYLPSSAASADNGIYLTIDGHDDTWYEWPRILRTCYFTYGITGQLIDYNRGLATYGVDGSIIDDIVSENYYIDMVHKASVGGHESSFYWWVNGSNGQLLDAAWISDRTNVTYNHKTVIVKVTGGGDNDFDDSGHGASWLWSNGKTSTTYYDKTSPNEMSHTTNVHEVVQEIVETVTTKQHLDSNGNWVDNGSSTTYSKGTTNSFSKTINYSAQTPNISQEKYKPLNLNRNGYATSEDISSSYSNASAGISATVNNQQGITNNSYVNALDTNSDTSFTFKFNNSTLGMPSNYNWNNTPPTLANSTYELSNGGAYANGKNSTADADGTLRYNLSFNASTTTNTKNPSVSSSSLMLNGKETLSNALIRETYQGDSTFTGGTWSARFTYADKYYTDNNDSDSKFTNWWVDKYSQGKFYEYGTEYSGNITTSGIENPSYVKYGTGTANSDGTYKVTTSADDEQRGFYVGYASQNFEQPILYGKWDVKTVAGDTY